MRRKKNDPRFTRRRGLGRPGVIIDSPILDDDGTPKIPTEGRHLAGTPALVQHVRVVGGPPMPLCKADPGCLDDPNIGYGTNCTFFYPDALYSQVLAPFVTPLSIPDFGSLTGGAGCGCNFAVSGNGSYVFDFKGFEGVGPVGITMTSRNLLSIDDPSCGNVDPSAPCQTVYVFNNVKVTLTFRVTLIQLGDPDPNPTDIVGQAQVQFGECTNIPTTPSGTLLNLLRGDFTIAGSSHLYSLELPAYVFFNSLVSRYQLTLAATRSGSAHAIIAGAVWGVDSVDFLVIST